MDIYEAFAHQFRGATIMFFLLWSVYLFRFRKDSRMMQRLFISTVCMCIGFLKDSVYLYDIAFLEPMVNSVVSIMDLSINLVVCIFFSEVVKPDTTRSPLVWALPVLELLFIPLYLIFPYRSIVGAAYIFAALISVCILVWLIIYAFRHRQYLETHYSSYENITVSWVVVSAVLYIFSLVFYFIAFKDADWLGEIMYCLFCQLIWTYLIVSSRRHRVVEVEDPKEAEEDRQYPVNLQSIKDMVEPKLDRCMQKDKLYLNPTLSLKTVSAEIATNTKYLSIYLNRCLGVTFYDYINSFRVKEACSIIKSMSSDKRLNMSVVAEKSGFNSLSSFNRYFRKVKGLTPMEYLKKVAK